MLSFLWNFVLLATQHLLLHIIMPSLKSTVERVMGPSPAQRSRNLQLELQRIREEGNVVRTMMQSIMEERAAREAEMERIRERLRVAGLLTTEELEVMIRAEEMLRRGGLARDSMGRIVNDVRRRNGLPVPDLVRGTLEELVADDLGDNQYEAIVLGPLRAIGDEGSQGRRSSWWCWLGLIIVVLVVAVVGLSVLVGIFTKPHIL